MPELPDLVLYLEALERTIVGSRIGKIELRSPFVLRTFEPELTAAEGKAVQALRRLGKRIVFELEDELFLVFHLMIAGRFQWKKQDYRLRARTDLLAIRFESGTLLLTEVSSKKRAALYVVSGASTLAVHDPGGLEVLDASLADFRSALTSENHTLKRALTDPRLFSGIGNAYSDEILHAARLSPFQQSANLSEPQVVTLYEAAGTVLRDWIDLLRAKVGTGFPDKVTAFHPEMSVHGQFGQPCPVCGATVQRIVYAENETNYCPGCQTGGKILADRALSRLLKNDWPRSIDEIEES